MCHTIEQSARPFVHSRPPLTPLDLQRNDSRLLHQTLDISDALLLLHDLLLMKGDKQKKGWILDSLRLEKVTLSYSVHWQQWVWTGKYPACVQPLMWTANIVFTEKEKEINSLWREHRDVWLCRLCTCTKTCITHYRKGKHNRDPLIWYHSIIEDIFTLWVKTH